MTFVFQQLVFLRDVYDHRHMFLIHVLYDVDRVESYESVDQLNIVNILNSLYESTRTMKLNRKVRLFFSSLPYLFDK